MMDGTKIQSILSIGAHPDDIEFGCLGFLLKQPASVDQHVFVASLGSEGDPSSGLARLEESKRALQVLQPKSFFARSEVGLEPKHFQSLLQALTQTIAQVKPDLILSLGPHDTHQEHRMVHELTLGAARRSKASILSYGILSNTLDFRPQIFVDVGEVLDAKKKALKLHVSQSDKYYMTDEYLDIFHSHNYASLHEVRYCEAFEVVRIFVR